MPLASIMIPQFPEIRSRFFLTNTNYQRRFSISDNPIRSSSTLFQPGCPFHSLSTQRPTQRAKNAFIDAVVAAWTAAVENSRLAFGSFVNLELPPKVFDAESRPHLPIEIELTKKALATGMSAAEIYAIPASTGERTKSLAVRIAEYALGQMEECDRERILLRDLARYSVPEGVDSIGERDAGPIPLFWCNGLLYTRFRRSEKQHPIHGIVQFAYGPTQSARDGVHAISIYSPSVAKSVPKKGIEIMHDTLSGSGRLCCVDRGQHTAIVTTHNRVDQRLAEMGKAFIFPAPSRTASAFRAVRAIEDYLSYRSDIRAEVLAAVLANAGGELGASELDPRLGFSKGILKFQTERLHGLVRERAVVIHATWDKATEQRDHMDALMKNLERLARNS